MLSIIPWSHLLPSHHTFHLSLLGVIDCNWQGTLNSKIITRVSISRLCICGLKKILQSLKPKGWSKMGISSLRQIRRRTSCAEESNQRKKGLACNIPNGMLFKCSLYVTARWDTMGGIQVTLGQVAFQMPPALRFLKTVLSERQLDSWLGTGHWERLSYGVCSMPSWALAVLIELWTFRKLELSAPCGVVWKRHPQTLNSLGPWANPRRW